MTQNHALREKESFNQETVHLTRDEAHAIAVRALSTFVRKPAEEAPIIADHLIDAELCGYSFAGMSRVITIAKRMAQLPPPTDIVVERETPASAVIDGGGNCGYVAVFKGMEVAREKAKESGFSIVTIDNTYYSGRGAYYVERLAEAGLIGIHVAAAPPSVAPYGGRQPVLGTNPVAIGVPAEDGPLVYDIGTSMLMHGEIELAERTGALLPPGATIDRDGNETTDPTAALAGAILPWGGYKGYGLALVVQALGLLSGSYRRRQMVNDFGFVHVAFSPGLVADVEAFKHQVSGLLAAVRTVEPSGETPVRIPSERSAASRSRALREGIDVDRKIIAAIEAMYQ